MMDGLGDLLRIDLSSQKISREAIPVELRQKFLGGEGINAWLFWEHFLKVDPKIDPLSPDNVLIMGVGPLASTGLGAGSKAKFTYKSPAYNLYGDTSCGGGFSSQLRWAGYDHIVITGKAEHPVYIWINDDSVEIRDARNVWGKGVWETDALIKEQLGEGVEAVCIGPAGENLVRFASIMASCHRAGGRGGGGCVFGSKNLKAIAARGTKGLSMYAADGLFEVAETFRKFKNGDLGSAYNHRAGTMNLIRDTHYTGLLAYRNHQGRMAPDEKIDKLDHEWYNKNIGVRSKACSPGCGFACGGWYHLKGNESPGARRHAGEWGTKPEFGATNPFGPGCDLSDLPEVCHINQMCNDRGMDVMEISMTLSFLMELWERGIISREDTMKWTGEPLSLEWGNHEAMEKIVDDTAWRSNELGDIVSGGVYRAAQRIGDAKNVSVLKYAMYGKAGAAHEGATRIPSFGIAMAVAPIGAHHLKGTGISAGVSEKFLGKPDGASSFGLIAKGGGLKGAEGASKYELQGAAHALGEIFMAMANSLGVCHFLCSHSSLNEIPLDILSKGLRATTGITLTPEELITAADRVTNIQKAFNSRLGLRREDDTVCYRWMHEPILEGFAKGMKIADFLEPIKDEYYAYKGWDKETSLQNKEKLEALDLQDVARVLAEEEGLADVDKR
jgi:aldehyde:ferredoxin oxidoreductase